jgi:O-antigen/teichoic acid export membrane protein
MRSPAIKKAVNQTIRARFGFSLFANLSKAIVTFGTGMLVARGLGPEQYGTMMFLLGTFAAFRQLLDMGSSTAFFTFLSQRSRSRRFLGWYLAWLGIQFLVPVLLVGLLFPAAWIELIWKGEQRSLVLFAFLAAYLQSVLWGAVLQMGESQRLTRWVQGVALTVAMVHFLLMVIVWWRDWLEIRWILIVISIEWVIAVAVMATQLRFQAIPDEADTLKNLSSEFFRYCRPLIPYAWIGFAYEFADRWLLQNYAGSMQQAYYSVAYQFGAVAAIATSSILNIFWKEIAEAHHQANHERVALLYRKVSRALYFVAAAGAGFLAPWAEDILRITLGPAYVGGSNTLMIMLCYPLHQSMGQIGGTMAYATGKVSAYVKIGMVFMASSMVVTYFVLASPESAFPGLGLGAMGLASKMVMMQLLSVNALAYYLARSLDFKFDWRFQPASALACLGAGYLAHVIPSSLTEIADHLWLTMLVAGSLYAVMLLGIVACAPSLAGLERSDIDSLLAKGMRVIGQ